LFREARLSYSKVREVTRVVDVVDEQRLAELALTATASQLACMISGFRSADGLRIKQQTKRRVLWHEREDGMVDFRARLPKEEAALLLAAMNAAKDQFGPPPPQPDPCGDAGHESTPGAGVYSNADALLDVARGFLNTAPEDRSGEDRTLVVVHVSAENLAKTGPDVPAGTSQPSEAVCHIDGLVRLRPPPRRSMPVTAHCWVPSSTSIARCWRWAAPVGWSVRRNVGRC
jgi:hypothetical protein